MNDDAIRRLAERARALEAAIARATEAELPDHIRAAMAVAGEEAGKAAKLAESALSGESAAAKANRAADKFVLASEQWAAILAALGTPRTEPPKKLPLADNAGKVTERVTRDDYVASPDLTPETPFPFPGGLVFNVLVPGGCYSHPWWRDIGVRTAAGAVTGVLVGRLAMDFYDKVLANRDGRPAVADWASGIDVASKHAHRWWEFWDDPELLEWLV